ncbi:MULTISPECIES: phosphotransferase family protein [unclassified Streptomyces]|uniref:phosphotransferase family protein n=1 Tax=unclassified Streptomyces TaxID=2593676 RepID=UPI000939DF41|nr:phosphotransferase [Streptomyces sp. TSRI0107]OKJ74623.1 aminoglycoside phosphotransferase [Streptomyces sp. TSRI0107]
MSIQVPITDELRSALGSPTEATLLDSSPRSRVWRVELRGGGRVIVKQITDGGGTGADGDARYAREVTALRLAARAMRPSVAPALLGTDVASRVMVLEHLDDLDATDDWMPGYAESLARLHALTGPADKGTLPAWSGPTVADAESFLALAKALDAPVPPTVPNELADLIDRLDPAPHHALLHGDPCPGNDLRTATGVHFVDFEQASLGNGLVELAYFRIGFPTCWCAMSVTAAPLAEAEAVYRATWRGLTGRDVPGDLADACAGWLIRGDALVERAHRESVDHLARVPVEDFEWGYVSARERLVHRLGVVADLTRDHDHLHALGRLSAALAVRLMERWPTLRALPTHNTRPWY